MLRPSGSTNHSLHGASRQSELESTSALRFNTGDANTSSVTDRNFAESNNRNGSGPNAPKVSGMEHGKAEALSDHIGVAESGSTNRPAQVESSASVSSRSSEEIKSVASSLAMSHETPGDLRAEDLTASIPSSANEALANAVATDASEDANQPDEPVAEIALVGIQGVRRELTDVSVVRSATTQPDTSSIVSQVPANSQELGQPTHTIGSDRLSHTHDDSSVLAADTRSTTVNEDRQVHTSAATNDSAASQLRSVDENTRRTVPPVLDETGSTSSDPAQADAHPGRLLTTAAASEASPLSPQSTSTSPIANAQAKLNDPLSYIAMKQVDKTQMPDPIVTFEGVVRAGDAPAPEPGAESAPVRLVQEATPAIESGRVANLKVELGNGETASATVRERAGSIEVKIVTPTSASAQRVSSEIDTMRQNLDAAGMRLGQTEVSYQPGGNGGRGGNQYQRPPQADTSTTDEQIFSISEVNE